jgi:hypothetical protein
MNGIWHDELALDTTDDGDRRDFPCAPGRASSLMQILNDARLRRWTPALRAERVEFTLADVLTAFRRWRRRRPPRLVLVAARADLRDASSAIPPAAPDPRPGTNASSSPRRARSRSASTPHWQTASSAGQHPRHRHRHRGGQTRRDLRTPTQAHASDPRNWRHRAGS